MMKAWDAFCAPANSVVVVLLCVVQARDGSPAWGEAVYEDLFGSLYGWCSVAVGVEPAVR